MLGHPEGIENLPIYKMGTMLLWTPLRCCKNKENEGPHGMAQWVNAPVTNNLGWTPGTHLIGQKGLLKFVLWPSLHGAAYGKYAHFSPKQIKI